MSNQREFGVVVVGLGIAGNVRVRDLKEESCGLRLKGVVSRRPVQVDGVNAFTFDEALEKPDVNVLILCTENALHEEYIRKGLEHGKHVLVEYPVALSSQAAKSLYKLAEDKGLVLHEENIAMLTESFLVLKAKASQAELKLAYYSLRGTYNGWLENFEKSGLPYISGISGIQTMLALFGDLSVVSGRLDRTDDGYVALADLRTTNGKPVSMTLSRCQSKDVKREKKMVCEFEDGETINIDKISNSSQVKPKPGLFMQDLVIFYGEIVQGKISDEQKYISIRSLEITEKIHSFF